MFSFSHPDHNHLSDRELIIQILNNQKLIMADLTQLTADVAAVKTVAESAITLLQGIKAQLDAAGTDPAKLAELSASLESTQAELAAAITANTPAAPAA